ncbi:glyoxylase-like metal-dependent hydrolase (beta-lactamase superfamily II) [Spinactinospora alkalitolerans]|uniref:Glyoxylase-like metal-dependent hydrolase (Beta-lactamase superfamily II) n=1 Tax=Spinactinospora alkalitolerans TaxID=687207 RepID=A0A852TN26_9ACTN|nr:MBL fold metallo-hydrolase [Spinactinospora alkalitolerans]NYE45726.1 glyoxylase-like metal-dependent hydrolase (beta-lactamase superfamily II) [Spinactinospora alkalitolerans]
MFWKRKDKKKDEADADGTATATAESEPDTAAESEQPDAEPDTEAAAGSDSAATEDGQGTEADERAGDSAVQRVEIHGELEADGEKYEVVTNTWIVRADDDGVIVIDPGNDAKAVLEAVGEREIYLVACTNGYNTHIAGAVEVAERDEAPIALHPRELRSWRKVHGVEHRPDMQVEGGGTLEVGDLEVEVLATPGTAPGSLSYYIAELGAVFSGDTLLSGRLGTVGEGYIDYTSQLASVGEVLLSLPPDTRVLPDSGEETTVGAESKNFDSWVAGD